MRPPRPILRKRPPTLVGRGCTAGRAAPGAGLLRPIHAPGPRQGTPECGIGPDVGGGLHHAQKRRTRPGPNRLPTSRLQFDLKAPHFTLYVRQQLEELFGPEALYQSGLNVYTTLDPNLQAEAERIVREQIAALAGRNVSNGALVAMRPDTGEVVALVGSADFDRCGDRRSGQHGAGAAPAGQLDQAFRLSRRHGAARPSAQRTLDAGDAGGGHYDGVPGWRQPAVRPQQLRRQGNGVGHCSPGVGEQPQYPGSGGHADGDAAPFSRSDGAAGGHDSHAPRLSG